MRTDIEAAMQRMPSKFGAKRELKTLHTHLREDETVHEIASGAYAGNQGILVATDRRLIFLFQGVVRSAMEDFSYDKISSLEHKDGLVLASITVYVSNQKAQIENLTKDEAKRIAAFARDKINSPITPATQSTTITDRLIELKTLHEAGVLTDDEYAAKSAPLKAQL